MAESTDRNREEYPGGSNDGNLRGGAGPQAFFQHGAQAGQPRILCARVAALLCGAAPALRNHVAIELCAEVGAVGEALHRLRPAGRAMDDAVSLPWVQP